MRPSFTENKLKQYTFAATLAGVGSLALTPPAQAGVIYHQVNQSMPGDTFMSAMHDFGDGLLGVVSFANHVSGTSFGSFYGFYDTAGETGFDSHVLSPSGDLFCESVPFAAGQQIGPAACQTSFLQMVAASSTDGDLNIREGAFLGDNKFLGFAFHNFLTEDFYYGWARFNIHHTSGVNFDVQFVDWAFESTANTPIAAGDTGVPEPSSLAMLALGATGLAAVRARRRGRPQQ